MMSENFSKAKATRPVRANTQTLISEEGCTCKCCIENVNFGKACESFNFRVIKVNVIYSESINPFQDNN